MSTNEAMVALEELRESLRNIVRAYQPKLADTVQTRARKRLIEGITKAKRGIEAIDIALDAMTH